MIEDPRGRWTQVLGLVFLAVVAAAIVLLIAGYGVVVGLGALAGLILGALAGLAGVVWMARGSGRTVTIGGMEWSSDSGPPTAHLMAEMRDFGELSSIEIGTIRAVVPVLAGVEQAGLAVLLVSVELHEAGLAVTFDVDSRPGVSRMFSMARISVHDDAGTEYRAAAQGQGGYPGPMRFLATAVPVPPLNATRLDVTIERFFDPFPESHSVAGPWSFSVPLPTDPSVPGAQSW